MYVCMHMRVCVSVYMYVCMILRLFSILLSSNLLNFLGCQFGATLRFVGLTFDSIEVCMLLGCLWLFNVVLVMFIMDFLFRYQCPKLDVVLFYTSFCWCGFLRS
jgi:hypothetical protein